MPGVLRRSFVQRLLGISSTRPPMDPGCVRVTASEVVIDLSRAPELLTKGGAIRLEGRGMPGRILVFRGDDGRLRALRNRCPHLGRRLDPLPGEGCVQCCGLRHATFTDDGRFVSGPTRQGVGVYWTREEEGELAILIRAPGDLVEAVSG